MGDALPARALVPGRAEGRVLLLEEPLSFWGGVEPTSGEIVDRRHPQRGRSVTGRVLVMAAGRGSSSSSTVLAETIRNGNGPAGLVLRERDPILALGALVAEELYGVTVPVVVVEGAGWARAREARRLRIDKGRLHIEGEEGTDGDAE